MFIVIATDGYEVRFIKELADIWCKYNRNSPNLSSQVYVNDLKHYMFQHRIPLDKVTTLAICGDVSIDFFGLCEVSKKHPFCFFSIFSMEVEGILRPCWFICYYHIFMFPLELEKIRLSRASS